MKTVHPFLLLAAMLLSPLAAAQTLPPPDLRIPVPGEATQPVAEADGADDEPIPEPVDPRLAFEPLQLQSLAFDEVVLHFEGALAPHMEQVQNVIRSHQSFETDHRQRAERLLLRSDEVIAELQRIVGLQSAAEQTQQHRQLLTDALATTLRLIDVPPPLHVYLLRQDTIKAHLRAGGELPGFDYDAQSDEAQYYFGVIIDGPEQAPASVLPLPVADDEHVARQVDAFLQVMRDHQQTIFGSSLHELARQMMLARIGPSDPYSRWFTEGFATALALRMTEKYVGPSAAAAFGVESGDYRDLLNEINLYYWMDGAYEVATPLDSEARLAAARYAFAVDEAKALIERHGLDVITRILDRAAAMEDQENIRDLRKLDVAIAQVTGVKIREYFLRYQRFTTKDNGIALYARQSNEALGRQDYEAMLPNVLRVMELREEYDVDSYANAAYILFEMGYEELGDNVFEKQLDVLETTSQQERLQDMRVKHLQYALQTEAAWKAYDTAEALLESDPNYVPGLAIRMQRAVEEADYDQAGLTARKIIAIDQVPDSPYPAAAREVLGQLEAVEP